MAYVQKENKLKRSITRREFLASTGALYFNTNINIQYGLPDSEKITVKIYNQLGEEIITLADTMKSAGLHSINWNGYNAHGRVVAAGSYFCRIKFNGHILTETITLVR